MDIEKLVEQLHIAGAGNPENIFDVAATALSTLQAELTHKTELVRQQSNELERRDKLLKEQESELEQVKREKEELAAALRREQNDN